MLSISPNHTRGLHWLPVRQCHISYYTSAGSRHWQQLSFHLLIKACYRLLISKVSIQPQVGSSRLHCQEAAQLAAGALGV